MFSRITSRLSAETNPLYRLRDGLLARGLAVTDLISGNVTDNGILFPQDALASILTRAASRCSVYRPDSLGQMPAREAISDHYRERGHALAPENILLTPGTSISYWYAFKLLADEGDEILCPRPSYPLFDYIGALSGVELVSYRLDERRAWAVDLEHLEACVSSRTRALVLISPHNPTGCVASPEELLHLAEIARRHDLALISDEVFSEFLFTGDSLPRPLESPAPLVLTLNGFSKMFALPGIKLGWMAVSGDPPKVRTSLRALELISDTFLPVNETVQAAAADIFREGRGFLPCYAGRIRERWVLLRESLSQCSHCNFVPPAGGFYVTLNLAELEEAQAAETILQEERLLVHPGYFYDMDPNHLVLSFVQEPETARTALPRLVDRLNRM